MIANDLKILEKLHFLSIVTLGITASLWAIFATHYFIPLIWLFLLSGLVVIHRKSEFRMFIKRFLQIGGTLVILSLLQIIFRRSGDVIFSVKGINLVYAKGLMEAILLWIRFMILFVMATIFSFTSLFNLTRFLNSIYIPLNISLLFSTTLKLIPFIYFEAKRILWFQHYRGISFRKLSLKGKVIALKKLLYPLLMRSINYISFSGLALELRGYGIHEYRPLPGRYSLKRLDYGFIIVVMILNIIFLRL